MVLGKDPAVGDSCHGFHTGILDESASAGLDGQALDLHALPALGGFALNVVVLLDTSQEVIPKNKEHVSKKVEIGCTALNMAIKATKLNARVLA